MKLYQLVAKDVMRRRCRVLYTSLSLAGQAKIYGELDKYGANLMVMPAISSEDKLPEIRRITDYMIKKALRLEDEDDIATIVQRERIWRCQ